MRHVTTDVAGKIVLKPAPVRRKYPVQDAAYKARRYGKAIERWRLGKANAFRRGIDWLISLGEYELVAVLSCDYCGGKLPQQGHGLDRLDNRLGYAVANVVPCCKDCNRVKGCLELAGFTYPRTVELMRELLPRV